MDERLTRRRYLNGRRQPQWCLDKPPATSDIGTSSNQNAHRREDTRPSRLRTRRTLRPSVVVEIARRAVAGRCFLCCWVKSGDNIVMTLDKYEHRLKAGKRRQSSVKGSPAVSRLFALAVLAVAVVLVAGSAAPNASAVTPTLEPWQSDTCFTSACQWSPSQSTYVAGGDGVSIGDYNGGSWGNLQPIQRTTTTIEALAEEEIPAFEWVPALQSVSLGLTAFDVGWKIGSTLNTKWFHIEGVGLGTTTGEVNVGSQHTTFHAARTITGFSTQQPAGWYYSASSDGGSYDSWWLSTPDPNYCDPQGGWTCAQQAASYSAGEKAVWAAANVWLGHSHGIKLRLVETNCTTHWQFCEDYYTFYVPVPDAIHEDQPLQPFTGQPFGIGTGWPVAGGCGEASVTCPYPGSQPNPTPSIPKLRCQLSGDATDCTAGGPHTCMASDVSGFFGGAGSTGCGLGHGPIDELNCLVDPLDYVCPPLNGNGTGYTGRGVTALPMPNCYGLTPAECEAAITTARPGVSITVTTAATPDPKVADGRVIATTPVAGTDPTPSAVPISINPDNANPDRCDWDVQYPHKSTLPGAVVVKAVAECNYQTTIVGGLTLWKCDTEPSADLTQLQNGQWGCVIPAPDSNIQGDARLAMPGAEETFQVPPQGGTIVAPDNKWFIAYGTLDKGTPSPQFSNIVQLLSP
jgi:hypothetical protein